LLAEFYGYASREGLDLFVPETNSILNTYDRDKFYDERVMGYHVVFHLCQFLGFDPLFFEPLPKDIFKEGNWIRQHFRDSEIRKRSSCVSDVLLTDRTKHPTYEQYSEGFIVAIMNSLIEAIKLNKDKITPTDLKSMLEKHMEKYLVQSEGTTPEGNSAGELVDEVWNRWIAKGQGEFLKQLSKLNYRRKYYLKNKEFSKFLEIEYTMDSESRFVRNAKDFHILLRNDEITGGTRDLYATQQDFDYMEIIFPSAGSTQARITDWVFIFSAQSSTSIMVDYVKWLEKEIWKI